MKNKRATKAVIPAAGLGTRFLPATKAQPKEMLPVVDTPAIQYVVEEAVAAGLDDILFITGRGKRAIEDHFDRAVELESVLEAKGDSDALAHLHAISELAHIHYIRQKQPLGLGHAVLTAARHVGDESFSVLLGDMIVPEAGLLRRMTELQAETEGVVLAVQAVPDADVNLYGIVATDGEESENVFRVSGIVEKPSPGSAPSNLAAVGRYVLPSRVFDILAKTEPGSGGEIQLTDAIQVLCSEVPTHAVVWDAPIYDIGRKLDYLRATVEIALQRPDLGEDFAKLLRRIVKP